MASLVSIEGIGLVYAKQLAKAGVRTTQALLAKGSTPTGRHELAEKSGVSGKLILEWINHADLLRVNGVGPEYADLLEAGGVDTVVELAQRKPDNLYKKLVEANRSKKLVRRLPTLRQVAIWIEDAKKMPRVVTY